jgi:hypothetical protein
MRGADRWWPLPFAAGFAILSITYPPPYLAPGGAVYSILAAGAALALTGLTVWPAALRWRFAALTLVIGSCLLRVGTLIFVTPVLEPSDRVFRVALNLLVAFAMVYLVIFTLPRASYWDNDAAD